MMCRLDYFFISGVLEVSFATILPPEPKDFGFPVGCRRGHFDRLPPIARGKGYWKFNVSFLLDSSYATMLKEKIIQWKIEIATEVEDHRVGWELIKFYIRQETIQYCNKTQGSNAHL